MCLAIPARIDSLDDTGGERGTVLLDGVRMPVSFALLDAPQVGEYVIVHVGYAIARLDADEAAKTLALLAEAGQLAPA